MSSEAEVSQVQCEMATETPSEYFFTSKKGTKLYCRYWNADAPEASTAKQIRGLVFVAHGLAEHCLCYEELAQGLIKNGFYVFAHDHAGHGQSSGDRVHIAHFKDYVEDILEHIDKVKERVGSELPVFIIGHSMGGTMAILAAMERPTFFKGVVLIAPLVQIDRKAASPLLVFVAKILARIVPQMHVSKLDPKAISRDEEQVRKYTEDPLVYHTGVKCGTAVSCQHSLDRLKEQMEMIEWPFYVLHGESDALCDVEGSKTLHEKARSKDKTLKLFPEAYHQLHGELEPVKTETLETITTWINNRA